jgi:PAS domain S-box-containing protein
MTLPLKKAALTSIQKTVALNIVLIVLYFVAARLSLLFALGNTNATPIWPPSGIALAFIWIFGYRVWPGIFCGAFLANAATFLSNSFSTPLTILFVSFFIGAGNTLEAILARFLLRSSIADTNPLFKVRSVVHFFFVTVVACTAAATIGLTSLWFSGEIPQGVLKTAWLTWWLGDIAGILTVTPLFLLIQNSRQINRKIERPLEMVVLFVFLILSNLAVFGMNLSQEHINVPIAYLLLPLIVWSAYRFGPVGAAVAVFMTLGMAIAGTIKGLGPFASPDMHVSLLFLLIFIGIIAVTGLILAAAINESQRAEDELRKNEQKFRSLVENSSDMIALLDAEGKILFASASTTRILGYEMTEYVGHNIFDFIHPLDAENIKNILGNIVNNPGKALYGTCRYRNKQGEWRWLEGTGNNLLDDLTVGGVVINYRDVTDKVKAQEDQLYLASIIENSDDAIFGKTLEGIVTSWNKGAEKIYGYEAKEVIGRSAEILVPEDKLEELKKMGQDLIQGKKILPLETYRKTKDAQMIYVSVRISPIKDHTGRLIGFSTITRDITEWKKAQEILKRDAETLRKMVEERSRELLKAQKDLKEAGRLADLGTLAATVAHELRNPLGVIQMAAFNLKRKKADLADDKHIANIEKKVWEGNQIINNLLSYSRIKVPSYEDVDVLQILDECVVTVQNRFQTTHQVTIERNYDARISLIQADPLQLLEIFNNILTNAYQAFSQNAGKIDLIARQENGSFTLGIRDNGVGIEKEDIEKVFVPFFTRKAKGTGLGLSICNELVNLHGGKIEVTSEKDVGTTVLITLPIKQKVLAHT